MSRSYEWAKASEVTAMVQLWALTLRQGGECCARPFLFAPVDFLVLLCLLNFAGAHQVDRDSAHRALLVGWNSTVAPEGLPSDPDLNNGTLLPGNMTAETPFAWCDYSKCSPGQTSCDPLVSKVLSAYELRV